MPLNNARTSSGTERNSKNTKSELGVVYDIILDESNENIVKLEEDGIKMVGGIRFRLASDTTASKSKLQIAYPKNLNYKSLPVKNEYVEITRGESGNFLYERVGVDVSPNLNSSDNSISSTYVEDSKSKTTNASTYSRVSSTGISRSSADNGKDFDGHGDYFEPQLNIHKLKLYEGDSLIESRFGQSIRFSGYNNAENTFSPTLIIRNNESALSKTKDYNTTTEEDVNRDGTIILLGSTDYLLQFQPGVVSDGGSNDFETKPNTFATYPSELKGEQLLLNSGRIILSAKTGELIFYSKKNYGFISDGALSIDNKLGIDITVGGDTNINTADRNVNINSGNGKINLGNKELESIVRGETLVDLMTQLIDAIVKQVYLTPAGPSATGPTNIATFEKIKSQLNTMLSTLNKTS
jgi:hypothetical protein